MPWVKFLKDYKPYKQGQIIDLPSFKLAFRLKNAGVLVRVAPPASAAAKAMVKKLTGGGAKKVK